MLEPGETKVIEKYIKNGDIVFDVGANIGTWTEQVLQTQFDVFIHAFEPLPNIFKYSNHNKIKFNNCLLSDCNSIEGIDFWYYPIFSPLSTIYRRNLNVEKNNIGCEPELKKIPCQTLDDYCNFNKILNIDFLKIDVEGAEFDVLLGSIQMLPNINYIQFEYGGCNIDSNYPFRKIYNFLKKFNFTIKKICENSLETICEFNSKLEDYQLNNFLAINDGVNNNE